MTFEAEGRVPGSADGEANLATRRRLVALLALGTLLAMSAWFSTSAVRPALAADRGYTSGRARSPGWQWPSRLASPWVP